jgi:hypothetical protein
MDAHSLPTSQPLVAKSSGIYQNQLRHLPKSTKAISDKECTYSNELCLRQASPTTALNSRLLSWLSGVETNSG